MGCPDCPHMTIPSEAPASLSSRDSLVSVSGMRSSWPIYFVDDLSECVISSEYRRMRDLWANLRYSMTDGAGNSPGRSVMENQ